ncbi:MAG: biotin synthase BioB [Saprospiraceae bacterium]|nr:biotin synthase BioB [Saprospiraceae bacterium]
MDIRNNWTKSEIEAIYNMPILDLVYRAATVHRQYNDANEVQVCTLLSVKTGGCPEDCSYCPQAARYNTGVDAERMLPTDEVLTKASIAKQNGATRFCMGAAWRNVKNNKQFDRIIDMVKGINAMDMEVCCTLGMLTQEQAQRLKDAGLYAYNHNLDTSESHYEQIITTRKYEDRLNTLENVRKTGLSVCSGGIIGLGETDTNRVEMLHTLATLPQHPESVPVNALVSVKGTPLEEQKRVSIWEMLRMIGTARIIMPGSQIRLSAGRQEMTVTEQAFCFMAGASSIFAGEKLLTTPNPDVNQDKMMFDLLGLHPRAAFKGGERERFAEAFVDSDTNTAEANS